MADEHKTIETSEGAELWLAKNELVLDGKQSFEDPTKIRQGAWAPTGWLAIISGDRLEGDPNRPRRLEKGFFGIRHDDDYPKDVEAFEFALIIVDPGQDGDPAQKTRLRITTNYIEYNGHKLFGMTDRMTSVDGRFVTVQQGDGNFVTYDTSRGPVGDPSAAVWSAWTGKI